MDSKSSTSSLSGSFENMNIMMNSELLNNKKPSKHEIQVCIEECTILASQLKNKSFHLNYVEKCLMEKEKSILTLSNTLNKYVKCKIKGHTDNMMNEANEKYSELEKKYQDLNRNYQRISKSFEALKVQNGGMKNKIENFQSSEETMKTEISKLKSRLSLRTISKKCAMPTGKCDVATQTQFAAPANRLGKAPEMNYPEIISSQFFVVRDMWTHLFQSTFLSIFKSDCPTSNESESLTELCLLIIPMAVDYLKFSLLSDCKLSNNNVPTNTKHVILDYITQHLKMMHWSIVYLDIKRVAIRKTMVPSLTRFAEELIVILRSLSDSSVGKWEFIKNHTEIQILILLVGLRTANHVNDLLLIINLIIEIVKRNENKMDLFLSKMIFVPLLCRWSSTFSCHGSICQKIIYLIHLSLDETCDISLNNNQNIITLTGLEQMIHLAKIIPIVVSSQSGSNNNYHILVLLLDLLYTSQSAERDLVIDTIEKMIGNKLIKKLFKEIGIISTISNLVSKSSDSHNYSQSSPQSITKLKSIITHLN